MSNENSAYDTQMPGHEFVVAQAECFAFGWAARGRLQNILENTLTHFHGQGAIKHQTGLVRSDSFALCHASLRVKIKQEFYRHGLVPPIDVVESSSYFALAAFVTRLGAAGFMARSVARHFEQEGLLEVLPLDVAVELPPVGIMTLRSQRLTTSSEQLIECLRLAVGELFVKEANIEPQFCSYSGMP